MPKKSKAVEENDYVYIAPKCEIHDSTQTTSSVDNIPEFEIVKKTRGRPTKKSEPNIMLVKEAITKKDVEELYGYVMHDVELSKKLKNKIEMITQ